MAIKRTQCKRCGNALTGDQKAFCSWKCMSPNQERQKLPRKKCLTCGKTCKNSVKIYCSRKCYGIAMIGIKRSPEAIEKAAATRRKPRRKCKVCGKECPKPVHIFCSRECNTKDRKGKPPKALLLMLASNRKNGNQGRPAKGINKTCILCSTEFYVKPGRVGTSRETVYCSKECRYVGLTINHSCPICGKAFRTTTSMDKTWCSHKCSSVAHRGKANPLYVHGKGHLPYPLEWREGLRRDIRKQWANRCAICNRQESTLAKRLSVHHIDYDKNNLANANLIPLCNRCHSATNFNHAYWPAELSKLVSYKQVI